MKTLIKLLKNLMLTIHLIHMNAVKIKVDIHG